VLGFELIEGMRAPTRGCAPKGSNTIALHQLEPGQSRRREGLRLYFEVQDLDRLCADLAARGVAFDAPPRTCRGAGGTRISATRRPPISLPHQAQRLQRGDPGGEALSSGRRLAAASARRDHTALRAALLPSASSLTLALVLAERLTASDVGFRTSESDRAADDRHR
jgi:hypothetical protein